MLKKVLREPLVHFLLLGAALFALESQVGGASDPGNEQIVIAPGRIEHLAASFQRTWQRPPNDQELQKLIESHIREEIYYREALALGLDKDDAIVRRRMTQKLEFLTEDAADFLVPTDDDLQAYLEAHPETFRSEPRLTLHQVYLDPQRHADVSATAQRLLRQLRSGEIAADDAARLGDRLMVPDTGALMRKSQLDRLLGERFADEVLKLETGRWTGPVRSGYGLHLVYVMERRAARLPALEEIRDTVEREWRHARRQEMSEAFYRRLRERYTVVVEAPTSESTSQANLAQAE